MAEASVAGVQRRMPALWFQLALLYGAVALVWWVLPSFAGAPLMFNVLAVVLASLADGARPAFGQAALATAFSWGLGALRTSSPVWMRMALAQSLLFWLTALLLGTAHRRFEFALGQRASQAQEAGERARTLERKVDQLNAELNKSIFDILAIYEFTTVLGSTLHLNEIFNMMVDTIMRVVRYDACFLALLGDQGQFEVKVARALTPEQLARLTQSRLGEGLVGRVAQTAQPLIVPDLANGSWGGAHPNLPYRSMLALPLVIQGGAIGVLGLFKKEADAFTQDDLRVLFIVANQCAFAVQNGKLYEEMARLAITDGLTGLYNHRYFCSCIEGVVEQAKRTNRPASMIMVDADEFKAVNDRYGHQRGDQVLQEIARLIQESVRETDLVARYGGEEFAVILPDTGPREAMAVARRIHQAVADHDFNGLRLTVSIGVATFPSPRIQTKDDLISLADEYAYRAKETGRNRICGEEGW